MEPLAIVTAFIAGTVLKEPAAEVGGMIADRIRFSRLKQALGLKEKTEKLLDDRGVTETRAVPLKMAVAVIEGATVEENDDLHTLWAKLLANALDPAFTAEVRFAYTEILKALSPFDARLLNEIYQQSEYLAKELNRTIESVEADLATIGEKMGAEPREVLVSADCLIRQRLIFQQFSADDGPPNIVVDGGVPDNWRITGFDPRRVALTRLGLAFVRCC